MVGSALLWSESWLNFFEGRLNSNSYLEMACSPMQLAKGALVTLLLALARQYGLPAPPERKKERKPDREQGRKKEICLEASYFTLVSPRARKHMVGVKIILMS